MPEQTSHGDLTCAFGIWRPGFEPHNMAIETEFRGILDRDRAFRLVDLLGQDIEQRRLPGSGATGNQQVQSIRYRSPEQIGSILCDAADSYKGIEIVHRLAEAADCDNRTVDRRRRNHSMEPRAVR